MLTDTLVNGFSCRKKITVSPQEKGAIKKFKPSAVEHVLNRAGMRKKEKRSNMMCITCDVVLCKDCYGPYHKTDYFESKRLYSYKNFMLMICIIKYKRTQKTVFIL
ncbi:piggyBac transposable element-derived protein 4-like [Aphis craccivora]|uniref:PiggyBac transposable element-derived protein 4-like n=1 Tax=Aphis craccivora TaxID=307492 RepID=A0A6G0Y1H6_APHCR|nr:piggyBac transposable element-derived protein 4-like [Aphis craccivora]